MIDTIRLAYPADEWLIDFFNSNAERIQKLSPDGEVLWEKSYCQTAIPSSFSGLRISLQLQSDLLAQGFRVSGSRIYFEFSLQKWLSDTGYNEKNTTLYEDINALNNWIALLSTAFDYDFKSEKFELYRVDFANNYILDKGSIPEFLRSLELKFSRHANGEKKLMRFDGALQYASRWIGKKLYHKQAEFLSAKGYFKKHRDLYSMLAVGTDMEKIRALNGGKRLLTDDEMSKLSRTLRFEVEFRRMFLAKYNITRIVNLPELLARFEAENKLYLSAKRINAATNLSNSEYVVVDLCRRLGITEAKQDYLRTKGEATWYRIKKQLQAKDIYLETLLNTEWRSDAVMADGFENFTLRIDGENYSN